MKAPLEIDVTADVNEAVKELDRIGKKVGQVGRSGSGGNANIFGGLTRSLSGLKSLAGSVASAVGKTVKWGLVAGAGGLAAGTAALAKFGGQAESTRLAFRTMLGSIETGDAMMAKLDRFSNSTPYSGEQVNAAAKTLLAFGVSAGNVEETLRAVGDVAAGSGKDFNELSTIYGKVFAKGKMDTEAMNQMVEAGIPIVKTLGQMFSKSGDQIYAMAEKGEISAAAVDQAFRQMSGSGGVFAGMMEQQSQTLGGMWGAITGQLAYAASNIGEAILPLMKVVLEYIQGWADKLAAMSADGSLIKFFGNVAVAGVTGIGEIIKWTVSLANHFKAAFQTIGAFGEMLWKGLQTGLMIAVTIMVAQIESIVNAAVAAYNAVVTFFGGKGKAINWTWTKAAAGTTADYAKETADAARRATDGTYFAEAFEKNRQFDSAVNGAVSAINSKLSAAVDKAAETQRKRTENIDAALPKDKAIQAAAKTIGTKQAPEKFEVDQLAKVGLYNFSGADVRSLDIERNNMLRKLLAKPAATFVFREV